MNPKEWLANRPSYRRRDPKMSVSGILEKFIDPKCTLTWSPWSCSFVWLRPNNFWPEFKLRSNGVDSSCFLRK